MTHLSHQIAVHLAGFDAGSLGAPTLTAAKRALLDGLGVMLAASGRSEEVAPFLAIARTAGPGAATILGTDCTAAPAMAALANGAMAHALDFEDAFDLAPCHPNAALLPAVLAVAQDCGPIAGRDLLAAIALGCDLACRLALAVRRPLEQGGWYPPPIFGGFGAAAAAGRLLRLDAGQMRDALSLMLLQTCPGEIKYSPHSTLRAVREAFPARAAVEAALLAAGGVRGFDSPFEGQAGFFALYCGSDFDEALLVERLGERFWIEDLSFKPWPACRGTHAFIEAGQQLRGEQPFDHADVVEVVAEGGEVQRMLAFPEASKRAPATAIDAKFSLPFTIAAALVHEEVTLASFSNASLRDPQLLALAARVRFVERSDWGRDKASSGRLTLRFADGSERALEVPVALGHPTRPLSDEKLRDKFLSCASAAAAGWTRDRAGATAAAIARLEQSDDAITDLGLVLQTLA